jgi:hypothetical protein
MNQPGRVLVASAIYEPLLAARRSPAYAVRAECSASLASSGIER